MPYDRAIHSRGKVIPFEKCRRCGADMDLSEFQRIIFPIDPKKLKWRCPKCGGTEVKKE